MSSRNLGETSTGEKIAIGLAIGSAVLGIGALILQWRSRKQALLGGSLHGGKKAQVLETHKVGDKTLTIYTDPDMPIDMRVSIIQDLTRVSLANPQIANLANAIVGPGGKVQVGKYMYAVDGANCGSNDACKVAAVGKWTSEHVRYTGDIAPVKMGRNGKVEGIDLFQAAHRTIEMGGGDCDDHQGVNASLLESVGVPMRDRITAPQADADWAHIYGMAEVQGRLVAVDTTLPGQFRAGREAPNGRHVDFPSRG